MVAMRYTRTKMRKLGSRTQLATQKKSILVHHHTGSEARFKANRRRPLEGICESLSRRRRAQMHHDTCNVNASLLLRPATSYSRLCTVRAESGLLHFLLVA
jgi:hypothetical protein